MTDQRFRRTIKYLRAILFIGLICTFLVGLLYFSLLGYAKLQGPPPLAVPQSTLYFSDDGSVIGESNSGQKRYWVSLREISPYLINATVSTEDKKFFTHNGFDYKRIAGAVLADVQAMSKVQGASTITQQYARNLFLAHDKTWKRKATEALYTLRLEMNYSKKEILEGYLNTIYYGNGAYGVQAASQFYFGKDAKELTLAEASMLAGIPKGPGIYSPFASMEKAKKRQNIILRTMKANGYIDEKTAEKAESDPLVLVGKHPHDKLGIAPYFQDAVAYALKHSLHFDDRTISLGGLKVYTSLNLQQQEIAEKAVDKMISSDSDIQVGMVAIDPKNGQIKAMIGGREYAKSSFNRAVQAVRQPGSTMKPLLYYAALENGFTPSTTMKSQLTTFRFEDGQANYTPHNFNNKYAEGEITMAQALALSDNVYAVKTHLFLGQDILIETARRFGITTKLAKVPSLALGTSGVRVIEMAGAYSLLANGGKEVEPVLITKVENNRGDILYEKVLENDEVLKPELASVMTNMLTGIFDKKLNGYSSVTGSTLIKKMTRPYAGKSGTTETDSWMIGYTPQLVSAVWTGYDKGKPIELPVEKAYAKNIWLEFMEKALDDEPVKKFKGAKGTVSVSVDPSNGKLASEDCPLKRMTVFKEGTEPTEYCTDHLGDEPQTSKPKKKKEKSPWYKRIFGR